MACDMVELCVGHTAAVPTWGPNLCRVTTYVQCIIFRIYLRNTQYAAGIPLMLEDIHALVQFAAAGSVVKAAKRLHRTPSAVTRQLQRLEAALGTVLLDRQVKPPRLTALGARVVEESRHLLKRVDDLKALTAPGGEPAGVLRIGVSHAL